jgi:hypothetical protein
MYRTASIVLLMYVFIGLACGSLVHEESAACQAIQEELSMTTCIAAGIALDAKDQESGYTIPTCTEYRILGECLHTTNKDSVCCKGPDLVVLEHRFKEAGCAGSHENLCTTGYATSSDPSDLLSDGASRRASAFLTVAVAVVCLSIFP